MSIKALALRQALRNIKVKRKEALYELPFDYTFPPNEMLFRFLEGITVDIPAANGEGGGVLSGTDGSMTVHKPFRWDGCSPRVKVKFFGVPLFSIGTPNGPRIKGTSMRKGTRASGRHDFLCRHARVIAQALGIPVRRVYAFADDIFERDIHTDWGRRPSELYAKVVRQYTQHFRDLDD